MYRFFFNTTKYSAVPFSHHKVQYLSIGREKGETPLLTISVYKFIVNT